MHGIQNYLERLTKIRKVDLRGKKAMMKSQHLIVWYKSYMSSPVQYIVGQLKFLKGDDLFLKLCSREDGVWVDVDVGGERRVGFSRHQPR